MKLFSSEDETLLVWRDTLFVLDFGLDVLDGVAGLNLQSDSFAGQHLHEDLHTTTQTQDKVECRFLLLAAQLKPLYFQADMHIYLGHSYQPTRDLFVIRVHLFYFASIFVCDLKVALLVLIIRLRAFIFSLFALYTGNGWLLRYYQHQ